jgi:hypothetical protein
MAEAWQDHFNDDFYDRRSYPTSERTWFQRTRGAFGRRARRSEPATTSTDDLTTDDLTTAPVGDAEEAVPMVYVTHDPHGFVLPRWRNDSPRNYAVYALLEEAKVVKMLVPSINSKPTVDRIRDGLRQGKRYRIVVTYGANSNSENRPLQGHSNIVFFRRLYRSLTPEERTRLDLRFYRDEGVTSEELEPALLGASHIRYVSGDGTVAITGSSYPHTQGMEHAGEADMVVGHAEMVRHWDRTLFDPIFERALPFRYDDDI